MGPEAGEGSGRGRGIFIKVCEILQQWELVGPVLGCLERMATLLLQIESHY